MEGDATAHGDGEVRFAPPGVALGAWRSAAGASLGPGGCERGLCGLVVVESRGAETVVLEGTSGVLLRPAPGTGSADAGAPAALPVPWPVPEDEKPSPLALVATLAALALAALAVAARR